MGISNINPEPTPPSTPITSTKKTTNWVEPSRKDTAEKIQKWMQNYSLSDMPEEKREILSAELQSLFQRNNTYTQASKKVEKLIVGIENLKSTSGKLFITKEIAITSNEKGEFSVEYQDRKTGKTVSNPIEIEKKPETIPPQMTSPIPPSSLYQEATKCEFFDAPVESPTTIHPFSIEGPPIQDTQGGIAIKLMKKALKALLKKSSYALGVTIIHLGILTAGLLALGSVLVLAAVGATLGAPGHIPGIIAGLILGGLLGLKIGSILFRNTIHYSDQLGSYLKGTLSITEFKELKERMAVAIHIRDSADHSFTLNRQLHKKK